MDPRDAQAEFGNWWDHFDEKKMTLTVKDWENEEGEFDEDLVFPAKYIVCELCSGKGTHVNPSIDAHGITGEEFANDQDFAEDYMRGVYDVSCYMCEGKRVAPVVDDQALAGMGQRGRELLGALGSIVHARVEAAREREAERRMGA